MKKRMKTINDVLSRWVLTSNDNEQEMIETQQVDWNNKEDATVIGNIQQSIKLDIHPVPKHASYWIL